MQITSLKSLLIYISCMLSTVLQAAEVRPDFILTTKTDGLSLTHNVTPDMIALLHKKHPDWDESNLFNTKILMNIDAAKALLLAMGGTEYVVTTDDAKSVACLYFDRGSDKTVIVGGGYPTRKETMAPYVALLESYNVILFTYEGCSPTNFKRRFGREYLDVEAVIKFARHQPGVKEVIGLGNCYSTYIFSQVQAESEQAGESAFDRLILDSPWKSMATMAQAITQSPTLMCSQSRNRTPSIITALLTKARIARPILSLAQFIIGMDFHQTSIIHYLTCISRCPVAFIYGGQDPLVKKSDFYDIVAAAAAPQVITCIAERCGHSNIHIKAKHEYAALLRLLISQSDELFSLQGEQRI